MECCKSLEHFLAFDLKAMQTMTLIVAFFLKKEKSIFKKEFLMNCDM